jgi:hypothetical protein
VLKGPLSIPPLSRHRRIWSPRVDFANLLGAFGGSGEEEERERKKRRDKKESRRSSRDEQAEEEEEEERRRRKKKKHGDRGKDKGRELGFIFCLHGLAVALVDFLF